MPYPEEAVGFQVDSPETWTDFKKRAVSAALLSRYIRKELTGRWIAMI